MRSRGPDSFFDMTDAQLDARLTARAARNEACSELRATAQRGGWRAEVAKQIEEGILPESSLMWLDEEFRRISAQERREKPHLFMGRS